MREDPMTISLRKPAPPAVPPFVNEVEPPRKPNPRHRRGMPRSMVALILILIVGAGYGAYWYMTSDTQESGSSETETAQNAALETQDIISRVGKLIVLPEGEEPTIATVTDPEKLQEQAFFARAKVGDKVLIYTQARKAYLFDPQANILLEVAPLTAEIAP